MKNKERDKKVAVSRSPATIGSADAVRENAERERDNSENYIYPYDIDLETCSLCGKDLDKWRQCDFCFS